MSTQEEVEAMVDRLFSAYKASATENMGCICYVFDNSEDGGGSGFNSENCDAGDAMVAIKRIAGQFGIDLQILAKSFEKGET